MRFLNLLMGGILALGGAAFARAAAVPFPVSKHFDTGETLGARPVNWYVTSGATGIYVVDTTSDAHPSPDASGAKAMLVNTVGSHDASLEFTDQAAGKIQAKLLLRINNEPEGEDYRISLTGTGGAATYFRIRPNGANKGFTYYTPAVGHHALLDGVVVGDWYEVTMTADLGSKMWDLSVSNVTHPSPAQTATASNLAFWNNATSINLFQVSHIGTSLNATLDALEIQAVPEPTTMGALGLGGLLLMRRQRKS